MSKAMEEEEEFNLTLEELQKLNETTNTNTEFNDKWLQFGGISKLCQALFTSTTSGVDASNEKNIESRSKIFGDNKNAGNNARIFHKIQTPGTILWEIIKETIYDRKLLIIQLTFLMEIIPLISAIALSFILQFASHNDNEENDNVSGHWGFMILDILFVPIAIVFLISILNNQLQKPFQTKLIDSVISSSSSSMKGNTKNGMANVKRNGQVMSIDRNDLLVGDICEVKSGDTVYADGLLFNSMNFVDEYNATPLTISDPVDTFLYIECGTQVTSGSGQIIVTAVGSNTRHARSLLVDNERASQWKPNILSESVRNVSKGIILTGIIIGIIAAALITIRFAINVYVIERQGFHTYHLQKLFKFIVFTLIILDLFLQKSFPLIVVFSQIFTNRRLKSQNIFVKNLDNIQIFGKMTTLLNFYGTSTTNSQEIIHKFKEAGIIIKNFQDLEKVSQNPVKPLSKTQAKLLYVNELIVAGEIVGVITGQDDITNALALKRAHLGITICNNSDNDTKNEGIFENVMIMVNSEDGSPNPAGSNDAEININGSANRTTGKDIYFEKILYSINQSRNLSSKISMFLQFLITMIIILGIWHVVGLVFFSGILMFKGIQILWIAIIGFGFGLTIAAEKPENDYKYLKMTSDTHVYELGTQMIPKIIWRNIIGQIIYQLLVLFIASYFFLYRYFIFEFHLIVIMTIFNMFNCRTLDRNICSNIIPKSIAFLIYWIIVILLQAVVIIFGDMVFGLHGSMDLNVQVVTFMLGIGTLLCAQITMLIPVSTSNTQQPCVVAVEEVQMVPNTTVIVEPTE